MAEGLEHPDLPDGTGEFLDAWLMLVEKMVNPTTVLESPHSLPAKLPGGQNYLQFSALRFLVVTQKVSNQTSSLDLATAGTVCKKDGSLRGHHSERCGVVTGGGRL